MDNELTFRAEKFLSAAIFVLWSVGVVLIPSLRPVLAADAILTIERLYLLFQMVLFLFAVYLLAALARLAWKRARRTHMLWRAALYIYVVVSLFWSIALTANTLA